VWTVGTEGHTVWTVGTEGHTVWMVGKQGHTALNFWAEVTIKHKMIAKTM